MRAHANMHARVLFAGGDGGQETGSRGDGRVVGGGGLGRCRLVGVADAVVDPGAVVVHLEHALPAHAAVVRTVRLQARHQPARHPTHSSGEKGDEGSGGGGKVGEREGERERERERFESETLQGPAASASPPGRSQTTGKSRTRGPPPPLPG